MSESKGEPNIELKGFKLEVPEVKIRIEGGKTYISAPNVTAKDVQIKIEDGKVCISGSLSSDHEQERSPEVNEGEAQGKGKIGKMLRKIKNCVKTVVRRTWKIVLAYLLIVAILTAVISYGRGGVSLTGEYFTRWQFYTFAAIGGAVLILAQFPRAMLVMVLGLATFLLYASLLSSPFEQLGSWLKASMEVNLFSAGVTVLALFVAIAPNIISKKSK